MKDERGDILVVDDNRMNRMKLSFSLEQQGHKVSLAEDGAQALDMLKTHDFDVVLLDIMMPGMDGYEVLERVMLDPQLRDIPVIVISALDEMDSVVRCIEMGAVDYLPKPFNPVLLKARISTSLQKKNLRDLEKAYLQQEFNLRQNEKLATLGKLSAGMAHELNNPAAAARSGASQLWSAVSHLRQTMLRLGAFDFNQAQVNIFQSLAESAVERAAEEPARLDALTRSDLERDLEDWLGDLGAENPWELAPSFVDLGKSRTDLELLSGDFTSEQLLCVLDWLNDTYTSYKLLSEIKLGTSRISEIVHALKAYSYMDQARIQSIDVHEGLNNTLIIMQSKLTPGIKVHREFAQNLPRIEAYGSELNQVWTHIIDNAIDAMSGAGDLTLRTSLDDEWVVVELEDSGVGIPGAIQPRVFDPFFTTKPPGQGEGLGLNISYAIVVHKHRGRIEVFSQPGKTRFKVYLPIN